jgi:sulfur relay (sulfurtransferase) DsrF/TusC family protein
MDEALIILTCPPFGRVLAVECLRMASGLKAMDINATIILFGEAMVTLAKNQDGTGIRMPAMNAALDILVLSEVQIAVIQEEMDIMGISKTDLIDYQYLEVIDRDELDARLASARCTFRF